MNKRLALLFRHVMYNLRGGFLVRPLVIALSLGFLGGFLSWLEGVAPIVSAWVPRALFPSHADPQVAQVILGGIAGSIMTVVSIVFAILLMTLTLASMQFSPRIIVSFAKDRVTQWTLGIFLGTFSYCMAALPAARSLPRPSAPVVTVVGAMFLAITCVGWLLFFIHHISQAISVNHIVDRIARETEAVIDEFMPRPRRGSPTTPPEPIDLAAFDTAVPSDSSGYIRFLDTDRVVELAKQYKVKVHAPRRVGHFVPEGVPLLLVHKGHRLTPEVGAEFRGAFDLGPARTLQQDVEFGVLQIVDVALKAISPAVNDPSTAVSCVDQLSRILIRFVSREPPTDRFYDPPGVLRASVPWISLEGLLRTAFEQIRAYSTSDAAVSLRLLRALGDIAATTPDLEVHRLLADHARRVVEGCAASLHESEMGHLRERVAEVERFGATAMRATAALV